MRIPISFNSKELVIIIVACYFRKTETLCAKVLVYKRKFSNLSSSYKYCILVYKYIGVIDRRFSMSNLNSQAHHLSPSSIDDR